MLLAYQERKIGACLSFQFISCSGLMLTIRALLQRMWIGDHFPRTGSEKNLMEIAHLIQCI